MMFLFILILLQYPMKMQPAIETLHNIIKAIANPEKVFSIAHLFECSQ